MDFGQVSDLRGIDLSTPPDDPRTTRVLAAAPEAPFVCRAGATGWTTEWAGKIYPPGTPKDALLPHYARHFNAVELNGTFYNVPSEAVVDRWRESVPSTFRFAPKFPKTISHSTETATAVREARAFCERMQRLGDRLGISFLQLPEWFGPEVIPHLRALLGALPRGFRVAVELRHAWWFRERRLRDEAYALLSAAGAATVITDAAGRRDASHGSLTQPVAFVRFLGNQLDASDFTRLDAWVRRIDAWRAQGLRELYFFGHQPDNVVAPELLEAFAERFPLAREGLAEAPRGTQMKLL